MRLNRMPDIYHVWGRWKKFFINIYQGKDFGFGGIEPINHLLSNDILST